MDASWLALGVAAVGTIPGTLLYLGARADRKVKQRDVVVGGYDRLVDDLRADNADLRAQNAELRVENAELRGERRPKPRPHRAGVSADDGAG